MIPPPNIITTQSQNIIQTSDITLSQSHIENPAMKEELKDKDDGAVNRSDKNENNLQVATTRAILAAPMTITNIPPLMNVPPPNIQQIIGNTLITQPPPNQPQQQQQIFNQIPVSIQQQQISTQPPQIQVSGGHFILNSHWTQPPNQHQQPQQQITQIGIQAPGIRNANEIIINNVQNDFQRQQQIQAQPQILQTFNPQPQMQIQFHPQIIQQPPPNQQNLIEQQPPPQVNFSPQQGNFQMFKQQQVCLEIWSDKL